MVYKVQVRTHEEMGFFCVPSYLFFFMWQIKANWKNKHQTTTNKGNLSRCKVYILIDHVHITSEKHFSHLLLEMLFLDSEWKLLDGKENKHKETASAITFPD